MSPNSLHPGPLHPGPLHQNSETADALPASLERARLRMARVLRVEAVLPVLLPAVVAVMGFAVLALLSLPQRLPLWLHAGLVLLLAAFVVARVWIGVRRIVPATIDTVDRRIEQRSGLHHRPLQTLLDRPAMVASDASQQAVWRAHQERTSLGLGRLRAGGPKIAWQRRSALLILAGIPALLLAGILAGPLTTGRLASGFLPGWFQPPGPPPWMQAWITPPDYARAAPVFLTDPHAQTTVPFGSVLQLSLTGLRGKPILRASALDPAQSFFANDWRPRRLSEGSWSLSQTLEAGSHLTLRGNGRALADWTIRVSPLPATLVAWDGKPGPSTESWRTRLPWRIAHPYGLNTLTAEIRLARSPGSDRAAASSTLPNSQALHVDIPIAARTREARGMALPDLSADPRAGEPVVAMLVATDVAGRATRGAEARFTLPARPFRNPLARAVLDTRKRVALGRESRGDGAADLQALGEAPGQFASDTGLYLNLASIASLLRDDDVADAPAIDEATGRLWELALGLEDGLHNDREGARAAADVRAARDAVSAQLEHMRQLGDKGQSDKEQSELEKRIQALSGAISRRMQALAQQALRNHTVLPSMPDSKMLRGDDLARMMQQMRDEAAHGHAQDAMQRLAQMQSMLDRMRAATPQDLRSAQQQAQAQAQVREQTEALKDLVRRQSALLDQTQARRRALDKENRERNAVPGIDPQTADLLRRLGIPPDTEAAAPSAGDETPPNPAAQSEAEAQADAQAHAEAEARAQGLATQGLAIQPAPDPAELARQKAAAAAREAQRTQDARVQHGLSRALGELGQEFKALSGAQPGGFDEARRDMGEARQALAVGRDQPAQDAQQKALAALQKGASQMQQALASAANGSNSVLMPGLQGGSGGNDPGYEPGDEQQDEADGQRQPGPRDPLGRPVSSGPHGDDGDTHVPDKAEQMRARDIEQELRRRDTDRTRPAAELQYLDRLLKPF